MGRLPYDKQYGLAFQVRGFVLAASRLVGRSSDTRADSRVAGCGGASNAANQGREKAKVDGKRGGRIVDERRSNEPEDVSCTRPALS